LKNIWHYKEYFTEIQDQCMISIGEGQTPLIKSKNIGPSLGLNNLYFKLENLNPTGSYKDRFAALFISKLLEKKAPFCIATSSGNTGAALAAYSAASGIKCYLVVVDGAPLSKIQQMQLYGGRIIMVADFGLKASITSRVFEQLKELTRKRNLSLPISAYCYCPEGMQGVQTIAWEIIDDLHGAVQHIFSPSGGGGLTLAIAKGVQSHKMYKPDCKVHCVQPSGNNTIAGSLRNGLSCAVEIASSTTKVSGLQVPGILDGTETIRNCRRLGGTGYIVDDEVIFKYQALLATQEGIFCEAAGAASVSALESAIRNKEIKKTDNIVCLITGSGFKDMSKVEELFQLSPVSNYSINHLSNFLATL
jgi:threonine synthase